MSGPVLRTDVQLPAPIIEAILAIPDLPSAVGELRCLTSTVIAGVEHRRELGLYSGTDAATEALLAVVARLATDHPMALPDAVEPLDCGCPSGHGVRHAVYAAIAAHHTASPRQPDPPEPSTGNYL